MSGDARAAEAGAPPSLHVWPAIASSLLAALLIAANGSAILGDPDTQWHLAVGHDILRGHAFPQVDRFSHTHAGEPWIAKEWLAQVALAAAERFGGWSGVAALTALAVIGAYLAVSGPALSLFPPLHAFAFLMLCIMAGSGGFLARPHVVSLPLFALFAAGLAAGLGRGGRPPWLLAPLMLLWANAHGFFILGIAMAGAAGLHCVVNADGAARLRVALQWACFGALLIAAACVTPYGARPFLLTFEFGGSEPRDFITEWAAPGLSLATAAATAMLAAALAGCLLRPRERIAHLLVLAWFGFMMLSYTRFALQFSVIVACFGAAPIADLARRLGAALPRREPSAAGLPAASAALTLLAAAGLAAAFPAAPPGNVRPDEALEAARRAGLEGPVFNSYDFGGALIRAGVPTFVDGRTDQLFRNGFRRMIDDATAAASPARLAALVSHHGVLWAIVQNGGLEDGKFDALGWRLVHRDRDAAVYARPERGPVAGPITPLPKDPKG